MALQGRTVVTGIGAFLVVLAAGLGWILGAVILPQRIDGPIPMAEFGPITFEITPLTMALYGAVTVGLGVAILLLLVDRVSEHHVEPAGDESRQV